MLHPFPSAKNKQGLIMIQVNLYWFRYFVELAISTKHPDTIPYQSLTEKQNFKVGGWSQLNSGEAVLVFFL